MSSAKKSSEDAPSVDGLWSETPAPAPVAEDVPSVMRSLLSPGAPSAADARPETRVEPAATELAAGEPELAAPEPAAPEPTDASGAGVDAGVDEAVEDSIRMLLAGFDDSFEEPPSPAPDAGVEPEAAPAAETTSDAIVVGEEPSSGVRDSGDFIALHSGEIEIVGLLEEAARRAPRAAPMPPSPVRRKEDALAGRPAPSSDAVSSADAAPAASVDTPPDEPVDAEALLAVTDPALPAVTDPALPADDEPVDAASLLLVEAAPEALVSEDSDDAPVDADALLAVVDPPLEAGLDTSAEPAASEPAVASAVASAMPLRKKKKRTKSGASTAAAGTPKKPRAKEKAAGGKKASAKKGPTRKKSSKPKRSKKAPQPEPRGDLGDSWAHQDEPDAAGSRVDLDNIVHGLERAPAAAPVNSVPGPAPLPSLASAPRPPKEQERGGLDLPSGGLGFTLGLAVAAAVYMFVLRPQAPETTVSPAPVAAAIADDPAPAPELGTSPAVQPPAPTVEEPPQAELAVADLDLAPADLNVPEPATPARVAPRANLRPARVQPSAPRPAAVAPTPAPEPEAVPTPEPAPAPAPVQATPAPAPAPAPPSGGRPSRAEVEAAIMQEAAGIRACAPEHHNHIASIRFTFGSTGRVMSAIVDSSFATPQARSCVARAARAVRVPPFSDSRLSVTYPMRF